MSYAAKRLTSKGFFGCGESVAFESPRGNTGVAPGAPLSVDYFVPEQICFSWASGPWFANVRFSLESGHLQRTNPCPLCANSGLADAQRIRSGLAKLDGYCFRAKNTVSSSAHDHEIKPSECPPVDLIQWNKQQKIGANGGNGLR